MGALAVALIELFGEAMKIYADAQHAKDEQHADILARVQASRAALAGDKSDAHKAVEAALAEAQSAIDAAKK
jgi:hypothetical protein